MDARRRHDLPTSPTSPPLSARGGGGEEVDRESCSVCYEQYDTDGAAPPEGVADRRPRSLKACGHCFCSTCLEEMLRKGAPKCPLCNHPIPERRVQDLPLNRSLQSQLQRSAEQHRAHEAALAAERRAHAAQVVAWARRGEGEVRREAAELVRREQEEMTRRCGASDKSVEYMQQQAAKVQNIMQALTAHEATTCASIDAAEAELLALVRARAAALKEECRARTKLHSTALAASASCTTLSQLVASSASLPDAEVLSEERGVAVSSAFEEAQMAVGKYERAFGAAAASTAAAGMDRRSSGGGGGRGKPAPSPAPSVLSAADEGKQLVLHVEPAAKACLAHAIASWGSIVEQSVASAAAVSAARRAAGNVSPAAAAAAAAASPSPFLASSPSPSSSASPSPSAASRPQSAQWRIVEPGETIPQGSGGRGRSRAAAAFFPSASPPPPLVASAIAEEASAVNVIAAPIPAPARALPSPPPAAAPAVLLRPDSSPSPSLPHQQRQQAASASVVPDRVDLTALRSLILTDNTYADALARFMGGMKLPTRLLYRASRDGFKPTDWQEACEEKGPTLTLVHVKGTGALFGAYLAVPWPEHGASGFTVASDPSARSFLFSLRRHAQPQPQQGQGYLYRSGPVKFKLVQTEAACATSKSDGPTFGAGGARNLILGWQGSMDSRANREYGAGGAHAYQVDEEATAAAAAAAGDDIRAEEELGPLGSSSVPEGFFSAQRGTGYFTCSEVEVYGLG